MIGLTFRQLEVFVEIVECGGITAAAEKLGITPVSVAEHLKALERQCATILIRRRRGVKGELSDKGLQTYHASREILERARGLADGQGNWSAKVRRRRIRLGAHEYIAELTGAGLARFMATFPNVDLEQERRPYEGVLKGLRDGELEMGIFLSFGPVPELESFPLWTEEVAFYAAIDHPIGGMLRAGPEELARFPFVQLPVHTHLRRQFDALLSEVGLGDVRVIMTGESRSLVFETLARGEAIGCLFARSTTDAVGAYGLRKIEVDFDVPGIDVRYAVRAPFHHDPLVQELAEFLLPAESDSVVRPG